MNAPMRPFLKWAGGKRWLFQTREIALPDFSGRYIERFLGGGAGFFHIMPERALLADSNKRLIELYVVVRDHQKPFELLLKQHAAKHSRDYYYQVRAACLKCPIKRAAQFLYLNRTCWNGLYRVNRNGEFNVPIGAKKTVVFSNDDFRAWSKALRRADIVMQDFEASIDAASEGDFLFVDPPYSVRHNSNGFVKYNESIFAWEDQERLRDALLRAAERGAKFAMTNADHESVRGLYASFGHHTQLVRHSVIAGSAQHRSFTTEFLVTI